MRKCDLFLLDCGGGVPEWEEGDHFWNEVMEKWRFETQFETDAAPLRKSLGGQ